MLILSILVDGATHAKKIDSNLLLFLDRNSTRSTPQKKNEVLYKSSPRFEPTTFLIQVNTKQVFTPKTTVPWLRKLFLFTKLIIYVDGCSLALVGD